MRAFSRAASMHAAIDDGLSRSKNMKVSMFRCTGSPYFSAKAVPVPDASRIASHSLRYPPPIDGISAFRDPTSSRRAVVSARSR